ncbi:ester cyclase [Sorangium sp. So ce1389]|uniref:ester cyclase n=1 Tax=Sorangium sp. So ce1389 TaxID=3133336 RepID=UPI003F5F3116
MIFHCLYNALADRRFFLFLTQRSGRLHGAAASWSPGRSLSRRPPARLPRRVCAAPVPCWRPRSSRPEERSPRTASPSATSTARRSSQRILALALATHRRVSVEQINIELFRGGKIVEHWRVTDELGLMRQLGAVR